MQGPLEHTPDLAIEQAWRLLQTHRADDAIQLLHRVLAADPDHAPAHAVLALALADRDNLDPARQHADRALALDPSDPLHHVVLGNVLLAQRNPDDADAAAEAALSIDPYHRDAYVLRTQVALARHAWDAARQHAEAGLAYHPQDATLGNLRVMALTNLGQRDQAAAASRATLQQNPESAWGHANEGWAQLHANHPKQAITHFEEALRLNAGDDWARAGLIEALKARNPVYRALLGFFLWMLRLSPGVRVGVLIGGFIAYQVLLQASSRVPEIRPFVLPLLAVYILFAVLTWVAGPLFNLLLLLTRAGRNALGPREKRGAILFGLALPMPFLVFGALVAAALLSSDVNASNHYAAMAGRFGVSMLLLLLPLAAALQALGTPRQRAALGTIAALAAVWLLAFGFDLTHHPAAASVFQAYTWAFIAVLWLGSFGSTRPTMR